MKILVVDDDKDFCLCIGEMVRLHPSMELIGIAHNGKDACIKIRQFQPDLILLDHCMPLMDGIGVITWMTQTLPSYRPFIFTMSAWEINQMLIPDQIRSAITYVIKKPVEWSILQERILQLCKVQEEKIEVQKNRISNLLNKFELRSHTDGYQLIQHALLLISSQKDCAKSITSVLYPKLAEQFETTPQSIERKIRYEIDCIFTKCSNSYIQEILDQTSADKGKLTNKQFLTLLARRLGYL